MTDQQPALFLIAGKIAAGKSTLAAELAARPATVLISEDHWMSTLFAHELSSLEDYVRCSARVRRAMEPHVVALLCEGLSVVMDFPANTPRQRAWLRRLFESAGVDHQLHYLDVPDEVCKARLRERNARGEHAFHVTEEQFDQFTSYFEPPSAAEGFSIIVHAGGD